MNTKERQLRILQVNTSDLRGGAAQIAYRLFEAYRKRGHSSWLAVSTRHSSELDVLTFPDIAPRSLWTRAWFQASKSLRPLGGKVRGAGRASIWARNIAEPTRTVRRTLGHEDFDFPATKRLLSLTPQPPDLLHAHNLHGNYFDLRELPALSHRLPVVVTLHDAWLLSGHCAHSFACEAWKSGCGHCPDLTIYPTVQRDATAYNWRRKRDVYARSRLVVVTPSAWLMEKATASMLMRAAIATRIIPNGVDTSVFRPGEREAARCLLGLPADATVILSTAEALRANPFKDYVTLRRALERVGQLWSGRQIILVALGETGEDIHIGNLTIRFVPFQYDIHSVSAYYQACDVFAYATRADTFPTVILEALACGRPVVATDVGGIPEQIRDLDSARAGTASGILVPVGDSEAMAQALLRLLRDAPLREALGKQGSQSVLERFSLNQQVDAYLQLYREILSLPALIKPQYEER